MQQVIFNGKGWDFFKIWMKNWILMILTLGLYSPWAKVIELRYFSENTELDYQNFHFDANPISILIGRLLMVLVLVVLLIIGYFSSILNEFLGMIMFMLFFPVAFVAGLRFRLKNTQYRGIRFNFIGLYKEAWIVFIIPYIGFLSLMVICISISDALGTGGVILLFLAAILIIPLVLFYQIKYVISHIVYGDITFSFCGKLVLFYKALMPIFMVSVLGLLMIFIENELVNVLGYSLILITVIMGYYYVKLTMRNFMYNSAMAEDITARSTMTFGRYCWVYSINHLLTILTLGLYRPFAMVNIARYKALSTEVALTLTLYKAVERHSKQKSAIGEEASDTLFGVDLEL